MMLMHDRNGINGKRFFIGYYVSTRELIEGKYVYTPFALGSVYFDDETVQGRKAAIIQASKMALEDIENVDTVVFRSSLADFEYKRRTLEERIKHYAFTKGITKVVVSRFDKLHLKEPDITELAFDAKERRGTVTCVL